MSMDEDNNATASNDTKADAEQFGRQTTSEPESFPDSRRLETLQSELDQMRDRWMRAEAETANVRATAKRDLDQVRQFAIQKFATEVVEAVENLERGLDNLPPPLSTEPEIVTRMREGFVSVRRSFIGLLGRNGIKKLDPTGLHFDPNLHQSVAEQEAAGYPAGTVLDAYSPTWTLNGRVLRPAMVVVSRAPSS
jgi:molecular chaperone GrpE